MKTEEERRARENRRCRCSSAAAAECIGNCDFLRKRYCHEELLRTALTILQPMYPYVSDDKMYPRLRESRTRVCDEYIWYRLLITYLIRHVSGKFERPLRRNRRGADFIAVSLFERPFEIFAP